MVPGQLTSRSKLVLVSLLSTLVTSGVGQACVHSPLILDLNGDGIQTTDLFSPVQFDFNGNGTLETTAWTCGWTEEAFLWLDRNDNGTVDSGRELFGESTLLRDGSHAANGFKALAEWDSPALGGNGDGRISEGDRVWRRLRLWIDRNHNGISEANEISRLQDFDIVALDLGYIISNEMDGNGNYHYFQGFYTKLIRLPGGRHGFARLSLQDLLFQAPSP